MSPSLRIRSACAALPLLACAGYPAPTEHMADSYASIRAAREVGAESLPEAALYLKLAEEEQGKAKALLSDKSNESADSMTLRAGADADLALALARDSAARKRAAVAAADVQALDRDSATPPTHGPVTATTTTTSTTIPVTPSK